MALDTFDALAFFTAIENARLRALLIGRRSLIPLGIPVLTQDYSYWVHPDDAGGFNTAVAGFDLVPNRTIDEARRVGRYVLEETSASTC